MYGRLRQEVGERASLASCEMVINAPLEDVDASSVTPVNLIYIGEVGSAFQFAASKAAGSLGDRGSAAR